MNQLEQLTSSYSRALKLFEKIMECLDHGDKFTLVDSFGKGENTLALCDNLDLMTRLLGREKMSGKIQLVYIDPPFFAKEEFMSSIRLESELLGRSPVIRIGAYDDNRRISLEDYLTALGLRLMLIRELLSDKGLVWLHLDRRVTHYARILMDMIYGTDNFVNEIIWTYKSGGASKKTFARKHDNILVYSKSRNYKFNPLKEKSYNRDMKPYHFKGVEEYQDQTGWYTLVNMRDVWNIDMVGRTSAERQGYATQKPEKLMERIIDASSDPGDICADFYGGSGAFAAVCDRKDRKWISCDSNSGALAGQIDRLKDSERGFKVISSRPWPEGQVTLKAGIPVDYSADLNGISCRNQDVLREYMNKDGKAFIRFYRNIDVNGVCLVSGYDILGNRFEMKKDT